QPETVWLSQMDSQALQQVLQDLNRAFINFFQKRANYPRFKSRKRTPNAFRIPQRVALNADTSSVYLSKIGNVPLRLHRPLEGIVKPATAKQSATGKWHISFVCHIQIPDPLLDLPSDPVGIDMGLTSFITSHDGSKTPAPRFYHIGEQRLRRLHRQ